MPKRTALLLLTAAMTVHMIVVVITTSLQSNLFTEWNALSQIPWMTATLKDFYQLVVPLWLWVIYKENNWLKSVLWGMAFVLLGSIATSAYVFVQAWKLKPGDPLSKVITR